MLPNITFFILELRTCVKKNCSYEFLCLNKYLNSKLLENISRRFY